MSFRSLLAGFCLLLGSLGTLSAQSSWTLRHRVAGGATLSSLATGGAGLIAVGSEGCILRSDNGENWAPANSGTAASLKAAAFGKGLYVVVGDVGTVLVSSDSATWRPVTSGTGARLCNVLFAQDKFVAVGEGGTILSSGDGLSWSVVASSTSTSLRGLAFGANFWVATGAGGTLVASTDAKTWKSYSTSTAENLVSVAFCESIGDARARFEIVTAEGHAMGYTLDRIITADVTQIVSSSEALVSTYAYGYPEGSAIAPRLPAPLSSIASLNQFQIATYEDGSVVSSASPQFIPNTVQVASDTPPQLPRAMVDSRVSLKGAGVSGSSFYVLGTHETIYQSSPVYSSRLVNISVRSSINASNPLTVGAVVRGDAPKTMLFRAVGPTLSALGVGDPLADPALAIFDSLGAVFASNIGWANAADPAAIVKATTSLGTFPLVANSADSALVEALKPGAWTFSTYSASGSAGTALYEAYDLDGPAASSKISNLSVLGTIAKDRPSLVAGLTISGPSARTVLIRAVGPTLRSVFKLNTALADPVIAIYNSAGNRIITAEGWYMVPTSASAVIPENNRMRAAASLCGAFPLIEPGNDSALIVNLQPGTYSIYVSSKFGTSGSALLEVYDIPAN